MTVSVKSGAVISLVQLVILLVGINAAPAAAQGGPDSFVVRGGGLVTDFNSGLRVDLTDTQHGTTINLENDLGFAKHTGTWFIDGQWRMTDRHRLLGSYVGVSRDTTKSGISQPITIRDKTYQIGANVQAFVDTSYLSFDYGFAFVKKPTFDLLGTIGLTTIKVHTGAGLAVQTTGGANVSRSLDNDSKMTTAFPVPGVHITARLNPRFAITGYTRFIKATLEGITESSSDGRAGVEVRIVPHVGAGFAYYYNRVTEEGSRGTFEGKLKYTFHGPQFYGLVGF